MLEIIFHSKNSTEVELKYGNLFLFKLIVRYGYDNKERYNNKKIQTSGEFGELQEV